MTNRIRAANDAPLRPERAFVLYWMIAARRTSWNFALDRAIEHALVMDKPLVVFEPLEADYPWASDRLHAFVIDGMADNATALAKSPVTYFPYVEPAAGAGRGLLEALASSACVVVTDEFPSFFLPRIVAAAAKRVDVQLEVVDSNGLMPLAATDRVFSAAAHFRRYVQKNLPQHLASIPKADPLSRLRLPELPNLPSSITSRWPAATDQFLTGRPIPLATLPIDHTVPVAGMRGGARAAKTTLGHFIGAKLARYGELNNEPEADQTSHLSPYLHFGHISSHEIFDRVMGHEGWSTRKITGKPVLGAREGWWEVSASAERFLDQLTVWRELGYNMSSQRPNDYDQFESLPEWARTSLKTHQRDRREHIYDRVTLERGLTYDRLWNAAQNQLVRDGWMHNYMRMLWGKKILEWSKTPEEALHHMIAIMNRYALDGRNPNSYSGYFWTLGRYDRPWPERPIFGVIRYMSSANTARKLKVKNYMAKYAPEGNPRGLPFDTE